MAKKKIKTVLKTKEKETVKEVSAIVSKTSIQYLDENFQMRIDIEEDCATMIRKNSQYEIGFTFWKDTATGYLKVGNYETKLTPVIQELEIEKNHIHFAYSLEREEIEYDIDY